MKNTYVLYCLNILAFYSVKVAIRYNYYWLQLHWVTKLTYLLSQRAKKVVSDSPVLVDIAIRLVNSVLDLPNGQVKFFSGIQITEDL